MTHTMQQLRARLAEIQLAVMLLTRLPAGRIIGQVPATAAASWAFPLAGLIVGMIVALVLLGAAWLGLPPGIAAGLALAAGIIVTGGLHEDGLADTADGFGGGRDREHKLAIMRDSRIGSFGALALILTLGLRWSAMATLAGQDVHETASAIVAIAVASRAGLAVVLLLLPPARNDGLGHAASGPSRAQAAVAFTIGLLALALLLGHAAALAIVIGLVVTQFLAARLALRQIGGQTGDVLGAMQQGMDLCAWILLLWLAN
jgi:adenosylcobinamide-GDP ribazoletransferase